MKSINFIQVCFLMIISSSCLAQQDTVKDQDQKKGWTISFSLGNAGISQSVFDLSNDEGDSRFFYDQFNIDNLKILKYSYGFGIAKEFNSIDINIDIAKGLIDRIATLGDLTSLNYVELKANEEYFAVSAGISKKIPIGKLIIKTGLSIPLLFSNGVTSHEYLIVRDSMSNITSESTIDYKYPNLFTYGIGIINELNYPLSSAISLGSSFGYYFLITDQSGDKKGIENAYPLYNTVVLNTMHQKTKAVSFSAIDLNIKLLINL